MFVCSIELMPLYGIEIEGMSNQARGMFLIKIYLQGHEK
jgi:hypothetical protein